MEPHYFLEDEIVASDETLRADLCVYGATAAGCIAACAAADLGLSVVLLHPGTEIGGMTTGGLSYTDVGNVAIVGGLAREYYSRIAAVYRERYPRFEAPITFVFEPHVASAVLDGMLAERGIRPYRAQFLDRALLDGGSPARSAPLIRELRFLGGLRVRADRCIDATYEGDLMAAAGVSFTTGRESNATYGETLNGMQLRDEHQFRTAVDPYRRPGDPASGLLRELEHARSYRSDEIERLRGSGDGLLQAYNFRVCMELRRENQVPFPRPDGYDADRYELLARWLHAMDEDPTVVSHGHRVLRKFDFVTTSKTDTNNWGAFSTDFIGGNYDWPTADYARREELFAEHLRYQKGYHYFMANDARVPDRVREVYSRWGLPRDEFVRTGHWPHQLYIREGRRMAADHVVTEHDCMGRSQVDDPVALGAYNMDSHNAQRIVVAGRVRNEGDVQVRLPGPYGIAFRAIVPRSGECANLLVPVALSASHIAFGSVRMEPVFMMLAESAAVAAAISLERTIAVQAVPYGGLAGALVARGQVLATDARNVAGGNPDDAVLPGEPLAPDPGA